MTDQQAFLEILTAGFTTGESKSYALSGGYFEILDCVYPVTVKLIGRHGELKGIMRNAEASFYLKGGDYQTITIQSDQAQTVRFAFGTSEAGTRRTAGVVSVIDGGLARTSAGTAHAWAGGAVAVAAQYSFAQLFNPAGSGKNVLLKAFSMSSGSGGSAISTYVNKTPMGALSGSQPVATKNQDAIAPVVTQRVGSLAAQTPNPKFVAFGIFQAAGTQRIVLQEPVLLVSGAGIVFENSLVNTSVNFDAEWIEQAI